MKKLITVFLAAVIAISAVACKPQQPDSASQVGNGSSIGEVELSDSGNSGASLADTIDYYGKVTGVVGNELDLNLAKLPEAEAPVSVPGDDEVGVLTMTAAVAIMPSGAAGGAAERVEADFTGEIKNFVVPAGLEIKDTMGSVKQLSDIKKGTMLSIKTDKDNNIVEVLYLG